MYSIDILIKPSEHGFIECNYCSGLGSLDRMSFGHIICSVCEGSGVLKIKSKDSSSKNKKILFKPKENDLIIVE